ncbi:TRAP transporter large permease subunit, partial [Escherichia coli]|nr:TRAP transporter large permease subunit [Escherichia coli]
AWLITIAELPKMVSELLQPLVDSPRLLLIVIMLAIMVIITVMVLTPTVLILTPVLMPLVKEAGIDPVYFENASSPASGTKACLVWQTV